MIPGLGRSEVVIIYPDMIHLGYPKNLTRIHLDGSWKLLESTANTWEIAGGASDFGDLTHGNWCILHENLSVSQVKIWEFTTSSLIIAMDLHQSWISSRSPSTSCRSRPVHGIGSAESKIYGWNCLARKWWWYPAGAPPCMACSTVRLRNSGHWWSLHTGAICKGPGDLVYAWISMSAEPE